MFKSKNKQTQFHVNKILLYVLIRILGLVFFLQVEKILTYIHRFRNNNSHSQVLTINHNTREMITVCKFYKFQANVCYKNKTKTKLYTHM